MIQILIQLNSPSNIVHIYLFNTRRSVYVKIHINKYIYPYKCYDKRGQRVFGTLQKRRIAALF